MAQERDAFKHVWKNKRDDHNREISGKLENHRTNNRRNKRRANKLKDRLTALGRCRKTEDYKEKALSVLTRECTSPDVTDDEEEGSKLTLIWESPLLTDIKDYLDVMRGKYMKCDHPTETCRQQPSPRVPEWAVRSRFRENKGLHSTLTPTSTPVTFNSIAQGIALETTQLSSVQSPVRGESPVSQKRRKL